MKNYLMIFVLIVVFGEMIGNDAVRNFFNIVWMIFWGLFIVFLFVHAWMDKKGMFMPDKMYKKKDKEG